MTKILFGNMKEILLSGGDMFIHRRVNKVFNLYFLRAGEGRILFVLDWQRIGLAATKTLVCFLVLVCALK